MSIGLWTLLWALNTGFTWWVSWGGGAVWFEGWRALMIVDWLFAHRWSSEQIALYTLICWVGHTIWFLVGLFVPDARGFYW